MVRRRVLARNVAIGAICAVLATMSFVAPSTAQQTGLADQAPPGFDIGAVLHSYTTDWDQGSYSTVAANEFNAITATAYMPWGPVPWDLSPSTAAADVPIDTAPLTEVVQWAEQRDMLVHGHVLLYPLANESRPWWNDPRFDGKREELARRYVETMAGANPGGVDVWDVVNEVLADPYQLENNIDVDRWGLRTNYLEYQEIGADYVDKAFRWADAVVDDDVKLIINDYGAETVNPKSDALYEYVLELRRRGVPIDGVGFQMHLSSHDYDAAGFNRTIESMETNLRRFADAGFDLYITELDVQSTENPTEQRPTAAQLRNQATVFGAVTDLALRVPRLNTLLMWDFADDRSWLHPTDRVLGDIPIGSFTYPTPWFGGGGNAALTPKPAYNAISQALASAPAGQDVVRLANNWDNALRYVGRAGDPSPGGYVPGSDTLVEALNAETDDWDSLWWTIEPVGNGYVRLRNRWGSQDGYLGRVGSWNGTEWVPEAELYVGELVPDGWNQQWRIEPAPGGGQTLVNRWGSETGALTRNGLQLPSGQYVPTNDVTLYPLRNWQSQQWLLEG